MTSITPLEQLARKAVARWHLECIRIEPIKVRENAVFAVHLANGQRVVLRIHRAGYHSNKSLASEFMWMRALLQSGTAVPEPIPSISGNDFELIDTGTPQGTRQVDVFQWIDGDLLGSDDGRVRDNREWITRCYGMLGELSAELHNHSAQWRPPDSFQRHSWDIEGLAGDQPIWGRFWALEALEPSQRSFFESLRARLRHDLAALGKSPNHYSLIHADLVPENVIVAKGGLRIIDFDDAGNGWHMFELATTLYFLRRKEIYTTARDALIAGYRRRRPLSDWQVNQLPMFLAARGTTYLGWLHTRKGETAIQGREGKLIDLAMQAARDYL